MFLFVSVFASPLLPPLHLPPSYPPHLSVSSLLLSFPPHFLYFNLPVLDFSFWPPCACVFVSPVEVCVLQETNEEGGERLLRPVLSRALFHGIPPHLCPGSRSPHASGWLAVHRLHHLPQTPSAAHTWGTTGEENTLRVFVLRRTGKVSVRRSRQPLMWYAPIGCSV